MSIAEQFNAVVSRKSEIKFDAADDEAGVLELNRNHIVVRLQQNRMVFETNADFTEHGISKNLENFAIDKVSLIPVHNEDEYFAYTGFVYKGVLYDLEGCCYETAYNYIYSKEFNPKYVPHGLKDIADKLKTEIENLPEVDYCKDASIHFTNGHIKIIHGPNTLHTYLDDCGLMQCGFKEANCNYIIHPQQIVGKCKGSYCLFVKIGRFTYKIDEIPQITYRRSICALALQTVMARFVKYFFDKRYKKYCYCLVISHV